jgi:hypothetical protein
VKEHSERKASIYHVSEAAVLNQGGVCDKIHLEQQKQPTESVSPSECGRKEFRIKIKNLYDRTYGLCASNPKCDEVIFYTPPKYH